MISKQFLLTRPLRDVTGMRGILSHLFIRFLLTRPLRDVTNAGMTDLAMKTFLLTRPLRDVTSSSLSITVLKTISTHTPLAGRDQSVYMH